MLKLKANMVREKTINILHIPGWGTKFQRPKFKIIFGLNLNLTPRSSRCRFGGLKLLIILNFVILNIVAFPAFTSFIIFTAWRDEVTARA